MGAESIPTVLDGGSSINEREEPGLNVGGGFVSTVVPIQTNIQIPDFLKLDVACKICKISTGNCFTLTRFHNVHTIWT